MSKLPQELVFDVSDLQLFGQLIRALTLGASFGFCVSRSRGQHEQVCFKTHEPIASSGQGRSLDLQAGNGDVNPGDQAFVVDGPARSVTPAVDTSPVPAALESPVPITVRRKRVRRTARVPINEKATHVDGTWHCKYCDFKPTTRQEVLDHYLTHFPTKRVPCEYCNADPTSKKYNAHYRNIHDPMQNEPKAEAGFKVKCEDCKQAWYSRGDTAKEEHEDMCPFRNGVLREGWRKDPDTGKFVRDNGDEAAPAGLSESGIPEVLKPASPLTVESLVRQHVGTYLRDGTPAPSSPRLHVTSPDEPYRPPEELRAFEDPSASRQDDFDTDDSDWPANIDPQLQGPDRTRQRQEPANDRNPHVPKARRARPPKRPTAVPRPPRSSPDTATPNRRNTRRFPEVSYEQFFNNITQDPTPASPKSLSKRLSSLHLSSRQFHQYSDLL